MAHVEAGVVFFRQLERVGKEQCAAVPPCGVGHVVGRHIGVAQVGAHVRQAVFGVAAEEQRVSL